MIPVVIEYRYSLCSNSFAGATCSGGKCTYNEVSPYANIRAGIYSNDWYSSLRDWYIDYTVIPTSGGYVGNNNTIRGINNPDEWKQFSFSDLKSYITQVAQQSQSDGIAYDIKRQAYSYGNAYDNELRIEKLINIMSWPITS